MLLETSINLSVLRLLPPLAGIAMRRVCLYVCLFVRSFVREQVLGPNISKTVGGRGLVPMYHQ